MQVHELLHNRRAEIIKEIAKLQAELSDIDKMLSVARVPTEPSDAPAPAAGVAVPGTKDEAILKALGEGYRTPAAISDFIRKNLGMTVNDASTRTRLSRMKAADRIAHDGNGWKLKD